MSKDKELEDYEMFKTQFGEENAYMVKNGIDEMISQNIQEQLESKNQNLLTKEDLKQFKASMTNHSSAFKKCMFVLWVAMVVISTIVFALVIKYSI